MKPDLKIAICDDEKPIRDYIEKCVREIESNAEIDQYEDASGMVSASFDADILFLDIQMPGMDGMKAARILRTTGNKTIIVFVTAIEEYVFKACDVGAVQYLVKPFEKDKLIETIKNVGTLARERRQVEAALSETTDNNEANKSFLIKSGGVNRRIILADIAYAEVLEHRIILHMNEREQIEYYGKMADLEKVAGDDFFRVHRAYLINLSYVKAYDAKTVTVSGTELPVARGKYRELVKKNLSYFTRKEHL